MTIEKQLYLSLLLPKCLNMIKYFPFLQLLKKQMQLYPRICPNPWGRCAYFEAKCVLFLMQQSTNNNKVLILKHCSLIDSEQHSTEPERAFPCLFTGQA